MSEANDPYFISAGSLEVSGSFEATLTGDAQQLAGLFPPGPPKHDVRLDYADGAGRWCPVCEEPATALVVEAVSLMFAPGRRMRRDGCGQSRLAAERASDDGRFVGGGTVAVARLRPWRRRKHPDVWVHCNGLDLGLHMTLAAYATREAARHSAEVHAAGWTSPAAMIPGEFEWRPVGDRVERLYMPHPTEPESRRTDHTVWHLTVNR